MPRAMRVEYPGAIYHVMDRGDRQEDIFADGVDRQDFLKTLAEACRKTDELPIKWIAARVHIGTAKGAKTVLHELAHGHHQRKPPSATERCAQLEFQSTPPSGAT